MKAILIIQKKAFLFILLFYFLNILSSKAQSTSPFAVFSDSVRSAGSLQGSFYIKIDTLNTDKIEVKIGNSEIDTISVFYTFNYDNYSSLPSGFSYSRNKDIVTLGVRSDESLWTYYCQVRIKNGNTWGPPYSFITN